MLEDLTRHSGYLTIAIGAVREGETVVSAALWAIAFGWLGYALGNAFETVLGDLRRYEGAAFATVVAAGVAVWLWRRWRARAAIAAQGGEPL